MKKIGLFFLVCFALVSLSTYVAGSDVSAPSWAVKGAWTDACCCKVPCPCLFGSGPTEGYCEGASLLEIASGHYGDVSLDGVSAVAAYSVGKWAKIYVSDTASKEQVEALAAVLPKGVPFLGLGPILKVEAVPLHVERFGNTVKYSVPETSVEIVMLESANGKPIKIENLPAKGLPFPVFHDHTQYKSRSLVHDSSDRKFNWSGRNAYISTVDIAGNGN